MVATMMTTTHGMTHRRRFWFLTILSCILACVFGSRHSIDLVSILKKATKRTRHALVSSSVLTSISGFTRPQFTRNEIPAHSNTLTSNSEGNKNRDDESINNMISSLLNRPTTSIFKDMNIKPPMSDGFQSPSSSMNKRRSTANSFVKDAVQMIGPSVARIDCEREIPGGIGVFGENFREGSSIKISGSGVIITKDGYLLTNAHVVDKTKKVTITLSNGRVYKSKVVAVDELTDLAVIKADIGSEILPAAPIGDSKDLQSGDWVIAVGCPVGLDFTVTLGIVSNPKRSAFEVGAPHMKGAFIQTDAALNQGNSGGPLVNEFGEVVGINTMVRTNTEAIGFAIPINKALSSYGILKEGKKPTHSYFGLEVMTLSPDWARIHNDDPNVQRLPELHGALVVRVVPQSPAAEAGIRKHDIITSVEGKKVKNSDDADFELDACKPGTLVKIQVARGESGKMVELSAMPNDLLTMINKQRAMMGGAFAP